MNLDEYKGVFVFAQQVDNKVSGIALEQKTGRKIIDRGNCSIGRKRCKGLGRRACSLRRR